ncbi:MAG: hypothetical protein KKC28_03950, partial [Verrucomicrobia bacterium]|nr:hypothetical protein [Verrucomicrobiota bacterium]
RLHVFPLRFLHHFLTPPFGSINYGATIPFCPPSFSLSGNIYCGAIRIYITQPLSTGFSGCALLYLKLL